MNKDIYRYYVYAYLRSNGTPYYIGKGCNKRAYKKHRHIPVPKDKSRILFLETNLTNVGACALERRYILWYGRKNTNTGILRNMTDGGEGTYCHIPHNKGKKLSSETKKAISLGNKGRKLSEQTKKRMSIAKRGKISNRKGSILSTETKTKISNSNRGNIPWNKGKTKIVKVPS